LILVGKRRLFLTFNYFGEIEYIALYYNNEAFVVEPKSCPCRESERSSHLKWSQIRLAWQQYTQIAFTEKYVIWFEFDAYNERSAMGSVIIFLPRQQTQLKLKPQAPTVCPIEVPIVLPAPLK
jgi:hypothetical protein